MIYKHISIKEIEKEFGGIPCDTTRTIKRSVMEDSVGPLYRTYMV